MKKAVQLLAIALWSMGTVVAVADMVIHPGKRTGDNVVLLLVSLGFLVLTIWVIWSEWMLNDQGIWDKLRKAIDKDKPEQAAHCIHTVLKDASLTRKEDIAHHLLLALQKNRREVAAAMLSAGAANPGILTPPHYQALGVLEQCVNDGNMPAVQLLLEHGAHPDAGTHYPPLLSALSRDRRDIAELLLAHGALPQGANPVFNPDRLTALHLLCSYRWMTDSAVGINIADRLLREGADINALTISGFTPLDAAMDSRFTTGTALSGLIDFLRSRGAERGALLSVPQAIFHATVLMKGSPTELPPMRHGCELQRVDATMEAPLPHDWRMQLLSQNSDGELPISAASRLALAVQELCRSEQAVAADLGDGYTSAAEIAAAEQPLLCMLCLRPYGTENRIGLETEGMARFGLPELQASDKPTTHRDWLVFAIRHVLDSIIRHNACPIIETCFPVGETEDDDIWSTEECFIVRPGTRLGGTGSCLEIIHDCL